MAQTNGWSPTSRRRGFTLVELLIGLVLGVLVIGAAITFLIHNLRILEGSDTRENVARNLRYVGVLLRQDLHRAGVDLKSSTSYGTVATWPGAPNDTLVLLHVPYVPEPAPAHNLDPTANMGIDPPPGEGTCGSLCVDLLKEPGSLLLQVGDLARLQVWNSRRLVIVDAIDIVSPTQFQVTFRDTPLLLRQPGALSDDFELKLGQGYLQELSPAVYYVDDGGRLIRATELNLDGTPNGQVAVHNVEEFELRLMFADGDEHEDADPNDTDDTNDYDDVVGVKVRVTLTASRVDPRVNNGELVRMTNEWKIAPRNLRYEKNRP
ncbi:MAG: prepilin-type N-terminal cleavage/methylation domain-containing protein [Gemmatimonadetes bacterium]|uniref:Prepilin-type N-terminal cleavage/methylation domain-containing protein n=1 Tax=Candidatus Kutchimonas denitrificans TaxID=3056748 RepID=A0AAE4Z9B8_9BACT|nr:prepilin-type N-terminal cleavage/methylation domain-containing protein [Gemmatimonadota bacterium]NIR75664.1 prepilin-type N-terminal cleavage/methylation domain-containing protein [Candidatus Kutchimonas denitrificans]NIR99643.1 prepilin-type N-terminal cleavage/methylation domain-containing protein [Gemmatimonadota bacterium]NIT65918.1 prepilin-type N-terminal cleavage/methylation domain-containing protein [Gemmatimonadota bacterium]NIV22087.1 prepilin-type N-terminal cleavage/methylation